MRLAAGVGEDLRAGHRLEPDEVGDFLGDFAAEAVLGGGDRLFQAGVGALLDGGAVALAPLDELQRLARSGVLPVLLGGHREDVAGCFLQHLARDREALQDQLAARRRRPTRTAHRRGWGAVPGGAAASAPAARVLGRGGDHRLDRRMARSGPVSLRSSASTTSVSAGSTSASATTSEIPRRWAMSARCWRRWRCGRSRAGRRRSARAGSSRWQAMSISSRRSSRTRAVGGSRSGWRARWATRARSSKSASRRISTSRSAVTERSKAFTRLDGRLTTSARRLSSARRAFLGGVGGSSPQAPGREARYRSSAAPGTWAILPRVGLIRRVRRASGGTSGPGFAAPQPVSRRRIRPPALHRRG